MVEEPALLVGAARVRVDGRVRTEPGRGPRHRVVVARRPAAEPLAQLQAREPALGHARVAVRFAVPAVAPAAVLVLRGAPALSGALHELWRDPQTCARASIDAEQGVGGVRAVAAGRAIGAV